MTDIRDIRIGTVYQVQDIYDTPDILDLDQEYLDRLEPYRDHYYRYTDELREILYELGYILYSGWSDCDLILEVSV